jgi:hypothetical protein
MKTTTNYEFGWGLHKLRTMDHYASGEDVALLFLQWLGKHLLKMFISPIELVVLGEYTIDHKDFVALALCTNKLYKIGKEGEFTKVLKQGCDEQYVKFHLKPHPWTWGRIV